MDNKPLEKLAENYIKTRLAKAKIKYLKPNYDTDGADLILLNPINKHLAKQVIVQSKGRNLTNNKSNVSIHSNYVVTNFICFLYIQQDDSADDYFYIFFAEEIKQWNFINEKYILNIPKNFKSNSYFSQNEFNSDKHISKIKTLLNDVPIFRQSYIEFEKMELTEVLFEMWKKYDSLPDVNLVMNLYDEFYSLSGSYSQDIFLIFVIGIHADKLEYRSLDHFMQDLYNARNIEDPIEKTATIVNPEKIQHVRSSMALAYRDTRFGQVIAIYDGIEYKALYCHIGDNEDHVEALLFDNGEYIAYGKRVIDK